MILIEKGQLKFLLSGRAIDVEVNREYRRNRSYAVGIRHNHTICRVQVLTVEKLPDGWRLTIQRISGDEVRLFHRRGGGYVTAPVEADPTDPDVLRGADFHEPEAVDAETQERLTELGTFRWQQELTLREAQRLSMTLRERLEALRREAKRPGAADVSKDIRVIEQRLRKVAERLAKLREDAA